MKGSYSNEKKKWIKLKISIISAFLLILFLGACTNNTETNAENILDEKILNKYSGDGADQLIFSDDELLVSTTGNIPPFLPSLENEEKLEEINAYVYKDISLVDGKNGEIIVSYDNKKLFKFQQDENNMLKNQDGTVYSISE